MYPFFEPLCPKPNQNFRIDVQKFADLGSMLQRCRINEDLDSDETP
jgi:hypothetical protein